MMDSTDYQRAGVYQLLSSLLYAPPADDRLISLNQWAFEQKESGFLKPLHAWLLSNLNNETQCIQDQDDILDTIEKDYAHLLTGIADTRGPKPPYECMYLSVRDPDMCSARQAMAAISEEHSIELSDPYGQASDHITCQLELMAKLARNDASSAQLQMCLRILNWVKTWQGAIQKEAPRSFYAAITASLLMFLELDSRYLRNHMLG